MMDGIFWYWTQSDMEPLNEWWSVDIHKRGMEREWKDILQLQKLASIAYLVEGIAPQREAEHSHGHGLGTGQWKMGHHLG